MQGIFFWVRIFFCFFWGLESTGFCFWKYKKIFILRKYKKSVPLRKYKNFFSIGVRKFHFPKYKEFFSGWIFCWRGGGLAWVMCQVALIYTTSLVEPALVTFQNSLAHAKNIYIEDLHGNSLFSTLK